MACEEILYAVDQGIATITLNRPDRLNAWTTVMEHEVRRGMAAAAGDDAVKVIMLTGAGRGFCAGADMSLLQGVEGSSPEDRNKAAKKLADETPIPGRLDVPADFSTRYTYFPSVPKPIIAAINGPAAGLGLIMSLYADFRFAADDAVFTTAFARRGLIAEHGIDWILPRIVGLPNALDLLLSARKVRPDEAQSMGLVNKTFPATSFMEDATAFAKELATMVSPRSMRVMKKQLWATQISRDLGDAVLAGNAEMLQSFESADFKEGVAHFVEQRAPAFTGT